MQELLFLTFLTGILLSSCQKQAYETEILIEAFPIEESLPGTRIDLADGEYLSNGAYFAGDYLVFQAIRDNYFLQIYDKEFNLVDKMLYKGEGPEELPDAAWQGQWSGNPADPTLLVFCDSKKRVASLNIHPFKGVTKVCDIPVSEWISPTSIYQTSDTTFVGITLDMTTGANLFSYNSDTKILRQLPSPFEFADGAVSFYTSQQVMDFNRKNLDICCAYNSFPSLVIYDKEFNIIRKVNVGVKVDTATLTNDSEYPSFSKVMYYNNFILAMLTDEKTSEAKLLVFDLNGNPRASFAIGKSIGFIADEQGQRLLTVKYDQNEDLIYLESHNMPELLK